MPDVTAPKLLEPRILQPYSACGSCIETLDDLEWVASTTLHVGEWALGVRSSDLEFDATIRRVLAAHVTAMDAPANFSALMTDADQVRAFSFLYRASDALVRTRQPARVLHALLHYLSEFADAPTNDLRIAATGFVVDGTAIVAPDWLRPELPNIETRLNTAGISVIDAPVLHISPVDAMLVVPEPALTIDAAALTALDAGATAARRELPAVLPGRYPIVGWALTTDPALVAAPNPAQAVAAAAQQVVNAGRIGAQTVLDTVATVLTNVPVSGMWWQEPSVLAATLLGLAGVGASR